MNLRISVKKAHVKKSLACLLMPLILTLNMPIAALAAPSGPRPSSVPEYAQNPKSVRRGPLKLQPVVPKVLPDHPTDLDLTTARIFEEPLTPMSGPAVTGENDELAKAVKSFKKTGSLEDVSAITSFVEKFPKSRWTPSIQLNLGLLKFSSGYMSQALKLWTSAWEASKNEKGQAQKAVADRCVAEILQLDSKVGRMQEIERTLAEIKGRAFQGSMEQKVNATKEALTQMHAHADKSFKCGPYAISSLLSVKKGKFEFNKTIDDYPSTIKGTSLEENRELAKKVGLNLQIAKRAPGAKVITPSLFHWTLGHFAAVTRKSGDRYEIKDPTFGLESMMISPKVLDSETDGYALVPAGPLPSGWTAVAQEEGAKVFGKGVPWLWPDPRSCNKWFGGPGNPPCQGMMQFNVATTTTDLHLSDTPLSYATPIGGTLGFGIDYHYLTADQPATFTFTNLGPNWSFQYLSYLTLDASSNATVRISEGFSEVYTFSGGVYNRDRLSQALLVNTAPGVYQRQLTDGSIVQYDLSDGGSPAKIFMTKIFDPQGNQTLIQYDANFRITSVTDPIGQVSTISYVSNTIGNSGFYKVSQISDPFSRTCSFSYDSTNTNLISTTDVIGLQSKMFYDTSSTFVTSLQTPYGTTSFSLYTPSPSAYPTRGLRIKYPDGTNSVIETWFGHEPYNATFMWNREAMELYPNDAANHDFSHCHKIAWLWNPSDGYLYPIIDYVKPPLENRITYSYFDEGTGSAGRGTVGTNTINKPIKVSRPAATPVKAVIAGTKTTGDILTLTFTDAALAGGSQSVAYTVLAGDTLTTIAAGMTAAVNANANLRNLGVTAASTGTNIALISQSANQTAYSKSLSVGATETISLGTPTPQSAQITLTGTVSTGNFVSIYLNAQGVSQGNAQYNIQAGDTLTTAATGLKNAVNASSIFTNRGITASSYGPTIFLTTTATPDILSYIQYGSGSPAMNLDYQSVAGEITSTYQNNALGNRTFSVDPAGRVFSYTYAANGIDLTQITEIQNNDSSMLGNWTYNTQHRATKFIDGNAQQWTFTYNSAGQLTGVTDPLSNSGTLSYTGTASAFLTQIDWMMPGSNDVSTYSYDGFNRKNTFTDSEGYQLTFNYDAADRLTQVLYPDGTSAQVVYNRLNPVFIKDRLNRWTQSDFDTLGQKVATIDPLCRKTKYEWCSCGSLFKLIDAAGNVTECRHDLQGRMTQKVYADKTVVTYNYEPVAGRTLSTVDALNQVTNNFFNSDGSLFARGYQNCVNPTSTVIRTFDSKFRRTLSVANDWGLLTYSYNSYVTSPTATPTTGAGQLSSVVNSVIPNSNMAFGYDARGQVNNRSIDGANNSVTWTYDPMFREVSESNLLGTFNFSYVDNSSGASKGVERLSSIGYPNGQTTQFDWYGNVGDQRLKTLTNLGISGQILSKFDYSYDPQGQIMQWQQKQNGGNDFHNFQYDPAGQLTTDQVGFGAPVAPFSKETYYAYDMAANRTSVQSHAVDTLRIGGTVTTGDVLTVTVKDGALSGGSKAVNYTVVGGDTLATIAQNLATNINLDTSLQAIGVCANAQSGKTFINIRSASGNTTSYSTSLSGGATETMTFGIWKNGLWNAVIGGTKTTGNVLTITVNDVGLSGGSKAISYTVLAGDTLTTIATALKNAINADSSLAALGVTATSVGTTISMSSASKNVTSYTQSVTGTETITLSINQNALQTATVTGTKTTGNTVTLNVYDAALAGGTQAITYTVLAGDTLITIAAGLTTAINANTNLQNIGVNATSSGTLITLQSKSTNATSYRPTTNAGATETLTISNPASAWTVAVIGGTKTTGNVLTLTFYDAGLTGGNKALSYTVLAADTLASITTNMVAAINADTSLQGIGVSATANSTVINIKSTSPNLTSYAQSVSSGSTETIILGKSTSVVNSTCNNVNELVAIAPGGKARFQGSTNKPVASASIAGQVVTISQKALNGVTFGSSVAGTPTETITLGTNANGNITATIGGTITAGDVLTISVGDIRYNNGPVANSYTVKTGDTTTSIATALTSIIYANIGNGPTSLYPSFPYSPTSAGAVITINPYLNYADVVYTQSVTGVPTETVSYSANLNGNTTATVGGTVTTNDVTSLTVYSAGLAGGSKTISYTSAAGNTTTNVATGLKNAINADTSLAAIGVTATSSAAIVTISTAGTTYTTSTSGGATVTLTQGANANGNSTVAVGGTATTGNTATITTFNPSLPSGSQAVTYTVTATDTPVTIAAGLAAAMNGNSNLQALGVTAKNNNAADFAFSESFSGYGTLPAAASLANVSATDAVPTTKANTNALNVTASASSTLTWDANGNMTSDGTNSYKWDAEDRLIEIDYPGSGNITRFEYDGLSHNRKITETVSGSLTTTKQFISYGGLLCEERDSSGTVVKRFFDFGMSDSAGSHFYTKDHNSSIRELCNATGVIESQYSYDPFGRTVQLQGSQSADFQYTEAYTHSRSQLNLAVYRQYNSKLGRWLNRDPLGELGGLNLFAYVSNDPISKIDAMGMREGSSTSTDTSTSTGTSTQSNNGSDLLLLGALVLISGVLLIMMADKAAKASDYEKSNGHRGRPRTTGQQAEEEFYNCRYVSKRNCQACCCSAAKNNRDECDAQFGPDSGNYDCNKYKCCMLWADCYQDMCQRRCNGTAGWNDPTQCKKAEDACEAAELGL